MRLTPFARFLGDHIYRVTILVICCPVDKFHPTVQKILKTTTLSKRGRESVFTALCASDGGKVDGCYGRCFRLTPDAGDDDFYPMAILWCKPGGHVSTLVHEAWHAAYWIFQTRGIKFDDGQGADEAMAYYLDWIVTKALGGTK